MRLETAEMKNICGAPADRCRSSKGPVLTAQADREATAQREEGGHTAVSRLLEGRRAERGVEAPRRGGGMPRERRTGRGTWAQHGTGDRFKTQCAALGGGGFGYTARPCTPKGGVWRARTARGIGRIPLENGAALGPPAMLQLWWLLGCSVLIFCRVWDACAHCLGRLGMPAGVSWGEVHPGCIRREEEGGRGGWRGPQKVRCGPATVLQPRPPSHSLHRRLGTLHI